MTVATIRTRGMKAPRAYQFALALALAIGYSLAVTAYVATGQVFGGGGSKSAPIPSWSSPLRGVKPYSVQKGYGTSGNMTCDLSIYTTNRAALDGNAKLRPGDTTATVCVVRKLGAGKAG